MYAIIHFALGLETTLLKKQLALVTVAAVVVRVPA